MPKQSRVSFRANALERIVIRKIAKRAIAELQALSVAGCTELDIQMDVTACHANGCPLRLDELLAANPFDFAHDIFGIRRFLDRTTGKIDAARFDPRFSAPLPDRPRRRRAA